MLKDELKITIQLVEKNKSSDESWVTIRFESFDKETNKLSSEINNKTKGYQFLANINTSEVLKWRLKNLIKN